MLINDVFVMYFEEEEAAAYEPVFQIIEERGGLIIARDRISEYVTAKYNRIVYLGLNVQAPQAIQFVVDDQMQVESAFLEFWREELGPVYMQDLEMTYGGNISEVYPRRHAFLTDQPVTFVGKFEKEMKTRATISAVSEVGLVETDVPLELQNTNLIAKRNDLAEYWDQVRIWDERVELPEQDTWRLRWRQYFPYILAALGGLLIFWGLFLFRSSKKEEEDILELLEQERREIERRDN